ncbi:MULTISPECIES: 2-oxo-tetronate isomerase [Caballeronia]|jgi:hydroxypyruvate isomerase|uniref:Hydroxypyruvate isomerase n=1 Tax=Caballeronia zhejiangensis TaxID=871203 RepID=A0A656QJ91_9BURK|nr:MULTISPECIES: 2-oxo-tetronate isomerase [Caballeronia]EKS67194.1 Hydroxypyruvate isomerase [Burkholderia sp. SJ98]KDR27698.1 hydroxypyruvate isomerase [Caballeronia zhejiangensis]MCG7405382.1 hydroxypyruvate isomerase family protein [Caballeronia zhejiangensis]MCI1047232.1 hydroxypyruvate isomerase family protein [Caballeronia zhejiangensis]MDR5789524.1 hydroxypyruvate isomerase family protein [Caballeronia sp. LP003]
MPRFAANLTMMYPEHAFLDRFAAAAKDGFKAVEFLFPYDFEANEIKQRLTDNGLTQALFNAPPGDWAKGERGIASLPGREEEFKQSVAKGLEYTAVLGNEKLHVMAGLIAKDQNREQHRAVYLKNLEYAAKEAQKAGITIVIEPINTRDIPGFFLNRQDEAQQICDEINAPNLKVQFDIYHCQIVEGDIAMKLKRDMKRPNAGIGHIQIAGVPERHEPGIGELNYPYLFELIDSLGYEGFIGCEYKPKAGTSEGLGWLKPYL